MGLFKTRVSRDDVERLEDAIRKQARELQQLREDHEKLNTAHVSLRGYTYAMKRGQTDIPPAPPQPPPRDSRDDLRRRSGFVPGKPMEHKDGNT